MLTAKQEKFVQNLIKGMSQREAYKNSYNNNMTDKQIDEEACKLLKNPKVNQRYNELIQKAEDKAIMSAIERKKWLTNVINNKEQEDIYITTDDVSVKIGSKNADLNTKMKAMDLLNKMDGEYTTKIEGNISVEKLEDLL